MLLRNTFKLKIVHKLKCISEEMHKDWK